MGIFENEITYNLLLTAITCFLGMMVKYLNDYWREKKESIKDDRIKQAINRALSVINIVVKSTNQAFVEKLKEEGKFNHDAKEEAWNTTKDTVLKILDNETKSMLDEAFKDSNRFINEAIESTVLDNKKSDGTK